MRRLLVVAGLLVPFAAGAQGASDPGGRAQKIKLAVMDLTPAGVPDDLAATVTSLVANELERQEVFEVVSKAEIRAMLTHEAEKQALGCDAGAECMSSLGNTLGVRYLISGNLGKIGEEYVLNLALTDAQASKVENRSKATASEQRKLLEAAAKGSREVVNKILSDRQATLIITCAEVGANVKIDGNIVGVTPLARRKIGWGPHLLEVEKSGFVTHVEDFTVLTNGIVERGATLIPSPDFMASYEGGAGKMRLGAWIATGAVVASFATAGYFQAEHLSDATAFDEAKSTYKTIANPTEADWTKLDEIHTRAQGNLLGARVGAGIGLVAAVAAVYLWVAGDDPDKYSRYRGAFDAAGGGGDAPSFVVAPAPDGVTFGFKTEIP